MSLISLPNEILIDIFNKSLPADRINLIETCQDLKKVGKDDVCWQDALKPDYQTKDRRVGAGKPESAKQCFIKHPETRKLKYFSAWLDKRENTQKVKKAEDEINKIVLEAESCLLNNDYVQLNKLEEQFSDAVKKSLMNELVALRNKTALKIFRFNPYKESLLALQFLVDFLQSDQARQSICISDLAAGWTLYEFSSDHLWIAKMITAKEPLQSLLNNIYNCRTEYAGELRPEAIFSGNNEGEDREKYRALHNISQFDPPLFARLIAYHVLKTLKNDDDARAFALFQEFKALYRSSRKRTSPAHALDKKMGALALV